MTKKHVHPILNQDVVKPWYNDASFPIIHSSSIKSAIDEMDANRRRQLEGNRGEYYATMQAVAASQVTVVIVNLNTLHLLKGCLRSLHTAYPNIGTIVIDNGSGDDSKQYLGSSDVPIAIRSIYIDKNIGHGPAMCKAIKQVTTPYFLTLDTDTIIQKPGFIEYMVEWLVSSNNHYAVGWKRQVHKLSGVPASWKARPARAKASHIDYIHPYCGMYKTELYRKLPPFEHHGAPCISNMREAVKRGYGLKAFPGTTQYHLGDYVQHLTGGTRRMYPVPDWDAKDKKPGKWHKKTVLNI